MTTEKKAQLVKKDIIDNVLARVDKLQEIGELRIPKDYSPENALRSAALILQETKDANKKPVLDVCTKESIANSLLNMVVQGLSPMKKQGDFIAYGNKLIWQREYHGNKALAKRYGKVKEITHNVVYEKDTFDYTIDLKGRKQIMKHEQKVTNIDMTKIVAAYAIATFEDGSTMAEIMTMGQIKQSWMKGATKGQSPAHREFPDKMAEKTVANRLCTAIINASDDAGVFVRSYEDDIEKKPNPVPTPPEQRKDMDFEDVEHEEVEDNPTEEEERLVPLQDDKEEEAPTQKPKAEVKKKEESNAKGKTTMQPSMEFNEEDEDKPF